MNPALQKSRYDRGSIGAPASTLETSCRNGRTLNGPGLSSAAPGSVGPDPVRSPAERPRADHTVPVTVPRVLQ
jgi:hypothetical protein